MRSKELSMEVKQTIISLKKKKKSIREISEILGVAKSTVSNILLKNERTGELGNSKRPGRPRKTTLVDDRRILSMVEKNPLTTSTQVKNTLQEIGVSVSKSTIKRRLHESKYCNRSSGSFEELWSETESFVKQEEQHFMEREPTPESYQRNALKAEEDNEDLERPSLVATPPSPREGTPSAFFVRSSGSFEELWSETESFVKQEEQHLMEREPTPESYQRNALKAEEDNEDLERPSLVATPPSPREGTSSAAALITTVSAAAVTAATYPNPTTGTSSTCGQNEGARQVTDRQLQREALSLIRRLNGNDEYDYFGYEIASSCRQMRPDRQEDFMSYIHAVTSIFRSNQPLPDIEDMICHVQWVAGLRPAPPPSLSRPEATSSTTQTEPVYFLAP